MRLGDRLGQLLCSFLAVVSAFELDLAFGHLTGFEHHVEETFEGLLDPLSDLHGLRKGFDLQVGLVEHHEALGLLDLVE